MAKFFAQGLAQSTQKSYKSGQNRYLSFCTAGGFEPLPASESVLCRFVAFLADQGLKHATIKVYLSAIRFMHISEGQTDPFLPSLTRLQYTLSGIKSSEAKSGRSKGVRLPVTPSILRKLKSVWDKDMSNADFRMLWAACCLGFFGFLRAGEMTVPSDTANDAASHLSFKDLAVDIPGAPTVLRVHI